MTKEDKNNTQPSWIRLEDKLELLKGCDPNTAEILVKAISDHNRKLRRTEMFQELCALQQKCQNVTKNVNARYTYANLEQWLSVTKQEVADAGFSIFCSEITDQNTQMDYFTIRMELVYKNGESVYAQGRFPRDKMGKTDVQSVGSTLTYARRYLLGMLLNMTARDDDNDGEKTVTLSAADATQVKTIQDLIKKVNVRAEQVLSYVSAQSFDTMTRQQAEKAIASLQSRMAQKTLET